MLDEETQCHYDYLYKHVFEIPTRYPHYQLLLKNILSLANQMPISSRIAIFERSLQYGGYSLFGPLFKGRCCNSIDLSPPNGNKRGAYNYHLVDHEDFIKVTSDQFSDSLRVDLEDGSQDLILVPNLLHHVFNQGAFFELIYRKLKSDGRVYIFEPFLREVHLTPYDYIRYTPEGLGNYLESAGFTVSNIETNGGPFEAIAYSWIQALQYLPEGRREDLTAWFEKTELPRLLTLNEQFQSNLIRGNSSFPMSYSVLAIKNQLVNQPVD